jgi:hypothetical protein
MTEPAVERFLEEQFASLAEAASSSYAESAHESAVTLISGLVDLDLLSAEEFERWTARLARASEDPLDRPLAAPDLRQGASGYVERCVTKIESEGEGSPDGRWRIYGALQAFVEIGLLSGHEFERWQGQLWQREATVSDGEGLFDVSPSFEMTHLMRVVRGPDQRVGGFRVTVVELYGDGVSIQWHRAPGEHAAWRWRRARREKLNLLHDPPLRLADERDTAYRWAGGGSSGGAKRGEGELGRTDFVPRVPEHVGRLLIEIEGQTLAVPL